MSLNKGTVPRGNRNVTHTITILILSKWLESVEKLIYTFWVIYILLSHLFQSISISAIAIIVEGSRKLKGLL